MDIKEHFKHTFEPDLLEELEKNAAIVNVKAGEPILKVGQNIKTMPIILKGSVKICRVDEDGRELLLYYVNANESCAMTFTCCMQQRQSEILAIAEEDVEMLAIPIQYMDEWMAKYPTWKSYVMRSIQEKFDEMLHTIDQIAFQKLDDRLVNYLKEKSKITGSSLINQSHEQIASELATSRVVISRLLKKLENDKRVILYRNQIKLLKAL